MKQNYAMQKAQNRPMVGQEQYFGPYTGDNYPTMEAAEEEYYRMAPSMNRREVNLDGLDGKTMLKSANQLNQITQDFADLDIRYINHKDFADPFHATGSGQIAMMDANSENREIRIYPRYFGKNSLSHDKARRHKGAFGFHAANDSYSLSHELGHIVNFHLNDKVNSQLQGQTLYGADNRRSTDTDYSATARALLANSLMNHATNDPKLQKILKKNIKARNGVKSTTGQVGAQLIADALNTSDKGKDSKLLKALHKGGYTSKYGASNAVEMYAEAFADHYQNETKSKRYRNNPEKQHKLAGLERERNTLSDTILNDSMEIFNNPDKLAEFLQFFGTKR